MAPIYDVSRHGYGCGFDLTLTEALREQERYGGTVMVSHDNGHTWHVHEPTSA